MDDAGASFTDRLKTDWQYLVPQRLVSRLTYRLTRSQNPRLKSWLIRAFIRRFNVDMSEAAQPDPAAYVSFNAFFTRALRAGARPLAAESETIVCPVDGMVSQCGTISGGRIFQAKGQSFTTRELLGGDAPLAGQFENGVFATLYLSPRDYHRIHMPFAGTLKRMLHVPGRLFSVNPPATRAVPRLFARNERIVTVFETEAGLMSVIMVGALNVGSIETVWAGEITPPRGRVLRSWDYLDDRVKLAKGAELGRFNMGSTVILLFPAGRVRWKTSLVADSVARMGQRIGTTL
ncbi:MAG: archaetidylserine decarboxylase [Gammaproteobacteria bacterium]